MTEARDARYWIRKLALTRHPEGGFFRLTYTADLKIAADALPPGFKGVRAASTAIYFLLSNQDLADLEPGDGKDDGHFSAFHRLRADELWHFHCGSPLVVHSIAADGSYRQLLLGPDAERGQQFQGCIEAGSWFASAPLEPDSFALVSCTVSPGFDFADFELARREEMIDMYPEHRELVQQFTRQ